jgi:hypothetical protein
VFFLVVCPVPYVLVCWNGSLCSSLHQLQHTSALKGPAHIY